MEKVSRFQRSTGFESFTDMVLDNFDSIRHNRPNTINNRGSVEAAKRGQSSEFRDWAASVTLAWESIPY
jgi:hypothetical protein